MKKRTRGIGITPLIVLGLLLSFFLVLITDGARLFAPKSTAVMKADILLEGMDHACAQALQKENAFSIDGSTPCAALSIGTPIGQKIRQATRDGRIVLLPSARRFCAHVTLEIPGRQTEDGFLAFGTHRLLPNAHIRLSGNLVTAEGRLLSLSQKEAGADMQSTSSLFGPLYECRRARSSLL